MKKKEAALALALIGFAGPACLKGMVALSRRRAQRQKKRK